MKSKEEKSISKNLENQSVDTEKVQGGLKISFDEYVEQRDKLVQDKDANPDGNQVNFKSRLRSGAKDAFKK